MRNYSGKKYGLKQSKEGKPDLRKKALRRAVFQTAPEEGK